MKEELEALKTERTQTQQTLELTLSQLEETQKNLQTQKNLSEERIQFLEKRNQDMQDLMAANPNTRPVLIENILTQVKSSFSLMMSQFDIDNSNVQRIAQLEEEYEALKAELALKSNSYETQIQALTDQIQSARELAILEFDFKLSEEKSNLEGVLEEQRNRHSSEVEILKAIIAEKEVDQIRFTEMVKSLTEQRDIRIEIEDLKETLNKQLALKDTEIDEMRSAIAGFHKALEESRMRELRYAM